MAKLIKLSDKQEIVVSDIARRRGCSREDVINDAIKLALLFDEVQSNGMELFYGKRVDDDFFSVIGVIEK